MENLILVLILAGAVYFLYYKLIKKKGCGCGSEGGCCGSKEENKQH